MNRFTVLASAVLMTALPACSHSEIAPPDRLATLDAAHGFTLAVPPFVVPSGTEEQDCYFFSVPDLDHGNDVWIDRIEAAETPGSHHMTVFRVKTVHDLDGAPGDVVKQGACKNSANWADWPLVFNSQHSTGDGTVDWTLPAGVAERFSPGEKLMLQTHYVNASTQPTPGVAEVRVNLHRAAAGSHIELGTLFATQQSIRVCQSQPEARFSGACSFPAGQTVHIVGANGHFHSRGVEFDMLAWDGRSTSRPADDDQFYRSTSWDDPSTLFGMDRVVPDGGGIWWSCSYEWKQPSTSCDSLAARDPEHSSDCCYTFGGSVEESEHCNAFVYYWPKVGDTDIFCN